MQESNGANITLAQSVKRENSSSAILNQLLSSENSLQLIRETPSTNLLLLIKEVGLTDSLELLELLSPGQVQEHLDLDIWRADSVNSKALGEWLEALFAANPRKAVQQLHGLDFDLLCLLYKTHSRIFDTSIGEEAWGESSLQVTTPDYRYCILFNEEEAHETNNIAVYLKQYLEGLFARDLRFAFLLLEAVRHETCSSLEESAYNFRKSRLADMGFPEMSDALALFAFHDPDKLAKTPDFMGNTSLRTDSRHYALQMAPQNQLVQAAMQELDQKRQKEIEAALIYLVNQVFVVRNGGNFDLETMKRSGEFAMTTMNLGLQYVSQDRPHLYAEWLQKLSPQQLFTLGFSLVLKVQRQWRSVCKNENFGLSLASINALDFPLKEVAESIVKRIPVFCCTLVDSSSVQIKSFSALSEVAVSANALAQAAFRSSLLGPLGLNVDYRAHTDVTHSVFFASFLCQAILAEEAKNNELSSLKFSQEQLCALFNRLQESDSGKKFSSSDKERAKEAAKAVAHSLQKAWPASSLEELEKKAATYAEIALGSVEAELARLDSPPVREFIRSVL